MTVQPSEGFWGGVGEAVGSSPGWMVVGAILVVAVAFIIARYVVPSRERVHMRELDIREREAQNDSERVKANAMLADAQRQTNVLVDSMRQSLDASSARTDVLVAEIRGSRDRSRSMGETLDRVDTTTSHTDALVEDIHSHLFREGTD